MQPDAKATAVMPQEVTIEDVLRMLREKSPRVAAEQAEVHVAAADVIAANRLPNPSVSYSVLVGLHGDNTVSGSQHQITIQQPLLIAGQRSARRSTAELALEAVRARTRARSADLARAAWEIFVALLAAQERAQVLDQASVELGQAQQIVEGRAQGGAMSRYDTLRVSLEGQTLRARLTDARTELDNVAGQLAVLLGLPGWRPKAIGSLRPAGIGKAGEAPREVAAIEAARKEEAAAHAGIDLAERERWPVPVVGAGVLVTTNAYSLSGYLGLSTDLPIFDWGQGPIARAKAQALKATRSREAAVAEAATELGRARRLLESRTSALSSFESDVMARLPTLHQMAEDAYRSGQGTILDLLDTFRTTTETRLVHLEYTEGVLKAEIEVLAAQGLLDPRRAP